MGISPIMEIFSHRFMKWLIQFSFFNGISRYINKANDRTSPAPDTARKNPAFSRGLQPIVNINETCVSLLWKPLGAQAKAISFIFIKAFQCASAAIPCRSHKSSSLGTRPGPAGHCLTCCRTGKLERSFPGEQQVQFNSHCNFNHCQSVFSVAENVVQQSILL